MPIAGISIIKRRPEGFDGLDGGIALMSLSDFGPSSRTKTFSVREAMMKRWVLSTRSSRQMTTLSSATFIIVGHPMAGCQQEWTPIIRDRLVVWGLEAKSRLLKDASCKD